MKKSVLAGVVIAALFSGSAIAADLRRPPPMKAPLPPPPPIFTWTGCYVGGHVGGLWASKEWFIHEAGPVFGLSEGSHDVDGFLGGIQGGCDFQFGGPGGGFVIGIAADYAWASADGSNISILFPNAVNNSEIESLASITGRVGWAVDRFLIYVKGGFAWERDRYHTFDVTIPDARFHASETRTGFTAGIGGEYAFTNFLSAFVEANWYIFDDEVLTFTPASTCVGCNSFRQRIEEEKLVVKGGLNFRFGGWLAGPPLAARY